MAKYLSNRPMLMREVIVMMMMVNAMVMMLMRNAMVMMLMREAMVMMSMTDAIMMMMLMKDQSNCDDADSMLMRDAMEMVMILA